MKASSSSVELQGDPEEDELRDFVDKANEREWIDQEEEEEIGKP